MIRRFGFTSSVIAFLLIGVATPGAAQSQQSGAVTVSQAVQEAVQKNLNLLAERYNVSVADAQIVTARMRPNPVLSIYGDLLDLAGAGFNELNAAGPPEYGIRTDWIIERGGKRQRRIEVAETARQVAQLRLINATRTLALDVQNAFVDTLLAKENLSLARENLKSFNQIVQVNKVRVQVGDLAPVELRRTQLAALQLQNSVLQAQTKLRLAKERLQLLMGRAWRQYETARALLADIENDMLKQARQVLDTMEFSYRRGEASFVEFLDARRASNDTTQSYNEARAEYARCLYIIDSTAGKAPR